MDFTKLINFSLDKDYKNTIVTHFNNIENLINTLHFCSTNKYPCLITDQSHDIDTLKSDITIIYNNTISFLSWESLNLYNEFIEKKYCMDSCYSIGNSIFNMFFIRFIDKNYDRLLSSCKSRLVGSSDSVFGIYTTFDDSITNCKHMLYYSFNLSTFVLYRVYDTTKYIAGKLPNFIKYNDGYIKINNNNFKCPSTFVNINNKLYGIRKRSLEFVVKNKNAIIVEKNVEQYTIFNNNIDSQCTYYLTIGTRLNKTMLENLHQYIILTCPYFKNKNNNVLYEPEEYKNIKTHLSLYLKTLSGKEYLILHINQLITPYLKFIIQIINRFFRNLSNKNTIDIDQYYIVSKYQATHIHLVSEVYYFIVCILLYFPRIIKNIRYSEKSEYIQANYVFSKDEVNTLYVERNKNFKNMDIYLKSIIIKTLSIFLKDYYCIIQDNDGFDLLPIYTNMSNSTIINLLDRSGKAGLSKTFLMSFLSKIFSSLNSGCEYPMIIVNINKIGDIPGKMEIKKVYAQSRGKNIPFYINVLYGTDTLHISLSYKEEYSKLKYIFNEVVEGLLEK